MSDRWKIKKKFDCPIGHRLHNYKGKCNWIHGHNLTIVVELEGSHLDKLDLIMDFTDLKFVKDWLDEYFDHAFLVNSKDKDMINVLEKLKSKYYIFKDENPSTENIAKKIYNMVQHELINKDVWVTSVEVWESDKHSARYSNNG